MSDATASGSLRSTIPSVLIEAPAGCGKTRLGATYACEVAEKLERGRVLILAHTHAACDAFATHTKGRARIEIRTVDSLIGAIASAYCNALGLPIDTGAWARSTKDGYQKLAARVRKLVEGSALIPVSLVKRYPVTICDEHQDASPDQHAVIMALGKHGASIRMLGDPMQRIYGKKKPAQLAEELERWGAIRKATSLVDTLDVPHRWKCGSEELGRWILEARSSLEGGGTVDLRGDLPRAVRVLYADDKSGVRGRFIPDKDEARPIRQVVHQLDSVLVLSSQVDTVEALRAFFFRGLPIWEGHTRDQLTRLVKALEQHVGNPEKVMVAAIHFAQSVATGFTATRYANTLLQEVADGCRKPRRELPAKLQDLAKLVMAEPDHKGVAKLLNRLGDLIRHDSAFKDHIDIDYVREFWDAVHLGRFEEPAEALTELTRRRTYARAKIPKKAISTIHKAKGLECDHVLIAPCDEKHFPNTLPARFVLYVAMSRPIRSLTFVVPRLTPTPLISLPR